MGRQQAGELTIPGAREITMFHWWKNSERRFVLYGKEAKLRLVQSPYFMLFGKLCQTLGLPVLAPEPLSKEH